MSSTLKYDNVFDTKLFGLTQSLVLQPEDQTSFNVQQPRTVAEACKIDLEVGELQTLLQQKTSSSGSSNLPS